METPNDRFDRRPVLQHIFALPLVLTHPDKTRTKREHKVYSDNPTVMCLKKKNIQK